MKLSALIIASALVAATASARLGWTKAQMLEKFKDPSVNHIEHIYAIDENNKVKALFDNDVAVLVEYAKTNGTRTLAATNKQTKAVTVIQQDIPFEVSYSEAEVAAILEINFPGSQWQRNPKGSPTADMLIITASSGRPGKDWIEYRRADGQVIAYQCTTPAKLVLFCLPTIAVIRQLREQQTKLVSENSDSVRTIKDKF